MLSALTTVVAPYDFLASSNFSRLHEPEFNSTTARFTSTLRSSDLHYTNSVHNVQALQALIFACSRLAVKEGSLPTFPRDMNIYPK